MAGEIVLDADGKIANQSPCIFQFLGNFVVFCEEPEIEGGDYVLRQGKCSVFSQQVPVEFGPNGQSTRTAPGWLPISRAIAFGPSVVRIPQSNLMWRFNTTDPKTIRLARSAALDQHIVGPDTSKMAFEAMQAQRKMGPHR